MSNGKICNLFPVSTSPPIADVPLTKGNTSWEGVMWQAWCDASMMWRAWLHISSFTHAMDHEWIIFRAIIKSNPFYVFATTAPGRRQEEKTCHKSPHDDANVNYERKTKARLNKLHLKLHLEISDPAKTSPLKSHKRSVEEITGEAKREQKPQPRRCYQPAIYSQPET